MSEKGRGGGFGRDICTGQSGHWDVQVYFSCITLLYLKRTGKERRWWMQRSDRLSFTGNGNTYINKMEFDEWWCETTQVCVTVKECCLGPFRSTCPEFDPAKDFIYTTAWGLDKRLVSAVWVVNNSHLPFLAWSCQSNNLAQTTHKSIHNMYVCLKSLQQSHVKNGILNLQS